MIEVGASIVDITPPAGLAMAGFAVRNHTATGAHDALTARALVVENTALVTVDVIGIDAALSGRVRARSSLPNEAIAILATHTHGGPVSMPGRLWAASDAAFIHRLENGIVHAIEQAIAARQPARVFGGTAIDPGYAKNRRQESGPVDSTIPILRFESAHNSPIAILTSYACHPVVLGADNLHWTGDYPHFIRQELETSHPGVIALFATGCAGDVNTGHSAASSLSNETNPERSFSMAKTIGTKLARSVLRAELTELSGRVGVAQAHKQLTFRQREDETPSHLAQVWRSMALDGDPIASIWADWAQNSMGKNLDPLDARCTAFHWCGAQIIAMPGEIFAQSALDIRQGLRTQAPLFVLSYADDNPGYIPPLSAFDEGGYEVDEAHRFYGLGATFAPGSAERLTDAARKAAQMAARAAADGKSR